MNRRKSALIWALVGLAACTSEAADDGSDSGKRPGRSSATDDELVPNEDPAPERTAPGEYTCKGCPTSEAGDLTVNVGTDTSHEFTGKVDGAEGNGIFHVEGPDGQTITGTIKTDKDGEYSFEAPLFCGEQTVKAVWSNEEGRYVVVRRVTTTGCSEPALRVTLGWDGQGQDFELHLVREGGRLNDHASDCTWTSCLDGLEWGAPMSKEDNPRKDVDNKGTFGPENIFLQAPADGTYTVLVEHWGNGKAAAGSVTIHVRGVGTTEIPIASLAHSHVFTAATITFPGGIVTKVASDYDCSAMWNSGCRAPLPAP